MNFIYNTAIHLYAAAARVVALRSNKVKTMLRGQRETLSNLASSLDPTKRYIWIHAASLGEFEQARPLIERIRREKPDAPILLTFFSPSGFEVRKDYPLVDVVAYLPFDTPRNARRFVDTVNPAMAIFVKYEFWGNYLETLKRKNVPTYIISAIFRPSQSFFKWWGGTMRGILKNFTRFYVQDETSRQLLDNIGINNVTVAGDTRFDRVTDVMRSTFSLPAIERFFAPAAIRLIAGSSWEADEELYLPYLNAHPEIKAVIAPHELGEGRVDKLIANCRGTAVRLSEIYNVADLQDVQIVIVDSFGKLSSLYRYGNIAYIGGGFGAGIHNINEAAVYSMPVIFGPRHYKFKEAHDLIELKGAFAITNKNEFNEVLDRFSANPVLLADAGKTAGQYIKRNLGATDLIYSDLFETKNS